ncbi:MAG: hypothetical protein WBD79_27240, partial [Anaerolineae bacterium]
PGLCPNFVPPSTIGVEDIQAIGAHWGETSSSLSWDPQFDLDQDGNIDMVDIMIVAGAWGLTC